MAKPRLQDTIRLSADGIAKVLGDLEARVMHAVWAINKAAPARAVHLQVAAEHDVALLTVITVLNKLVVKGLLRREKIEGLLHYQSRMTEEEFRLQAARRVVDGILSFGHSALAASFVDALAEIDPDTLVEIERRIQVRLGEKSA